ncbi:alpha-L-iduronidase isoform X2 [Eurosta solidaginis]|uniref:alpha-L-iduronidase isoform X2 n=1 Tax=Eurosta solidaginis TaxID=178769 RepID=UPI003530E8DD
MLGTFLICLAALVPLKNYSYTIDESYHELPRFWTSTGFCPPGDIERHNLKSVLNSDEIQMNILQIAALPNAALTHIRIHWLLKLVKFVEYTPAGVPVYDFNDLDTFIVDLDDLELSPVIEFMTDLDGILMDNPDIESFLWQDFSYQVAKRYLNFLGAEKVLKWRFETWNEPDVLNYNRLNFTVEGFLKYVTALRKGLTTAGHRLNSSLHFTLRGPAGLFKLENKHPLCWALLQICNSKIDQCPIDVLTYHRKGQGLATDVLESSRQFLEKAYEKYANIRSIPISNDEADPIAGWSTPQDYHEDVRYAAKLIYIVLLHWHSKLQNAEFKNLETISHDNAFISYHPYEFSQRTLLAHFRMNNSLPVHSQFIQKPVYAALGMLSKLGSLATDIETLPLNGSQSGIWLLKSVSVSENLLYLSWLILPKENTTNFENFTLHRHLPFVLSNNTILAYVIEILEQGYTDPAHIWRTQAGETPFPNAKQRAEMRHAQTPRLQASGVLTSPELYVAIGDFQPPWILLFRLCSNFSSILKQPKKLLLRQVTTGEVFLSWREAEGSSHYLKTYEVWFQTKTTSEWKLVSENWHLPFPSFQFAPMDSFVNGFYKVRGLDFFNRRSEFSEITEYVEI